MQYSGGFKKQLQGGESGSKPESDEALPETQDYRGEAPVRPSPPSSGSPDSRSSTSGSEAEVDSPDRRSQPAPKSWEQDKKPWISKLGPPVLKS
eukprot:6757756-Pyramimonas_sp.AAC.1